MTMRNDAELREKLAAIEHERWARWQAYLHAQCVRNPDGSLTIPAALVDRWELQITTAYEDLTDEEKASDRAEVEHYWWLIRPGGDLTDGH